MATDPQPNLLLKIIAILRLMGDLQNVRLDSAGVLTDQCGMETLVA